MLTLLSHSACPKSSCSQLTLFVIILTESRKQKSEDSTGQERPKAKEARKERKVLEKKMALNRKRKLDSRLVIQQLLQHQNLKTQNIKLSPKKADKLVSKWFVCTILKDTHKFLTPRKEGEISSKKKGDAEVSKKMVRKINRF